MFKIIKKSKNSKARLGTIITAHGKIATPAFLPDATRGYVKLHDNADLERIGIGPMVVNTFHLYLQPGTSIIKKAKGIHGFMGWDKPLVSDSGGFQVFSLIHKNPKMGKLSDAKAVFRSPVNGEKHEFTPEKSIRIQFNLGADIIVCFDDCPPNDYDRAGIEKAVKRTVAWAKRCKKEYDKQLVKRNLISPDSRFFPVQLRTNHGDGRRKQTAYMETRRDSSPAARNDMGTARNDNRETRNDMGTARNDQGAILNGSRPLLIAVIQGGAFKDLRKTCADELKKIGFDGYGYGARPVGKDGKFLGDIIRFTAEQIPDSSFRFALGVGLPEDILRCVSAGWDLFDCVIPTREGRHGRLFTWRKKIKILPVNVNEKNKRNFYEPISIISGKYRSDLQPINKYSNIRELREYSRAYLHHLFKSRDPLGQKLASLNNLEFYLDLMREIRNNIHIS